MFLAGIISLIVLPQSLLAISCNFEVDFCEWKQNATDILQWIRDNGSELLKYAPMYDHTLNGKGYYLFIHNLSASLPNHTARLSTILQTATSANQCFSFWYHMYGPSIGTLSLKVQQEGRPEELLWTRTGTNGNQWRWAFHTIPPQNKHFQLIFEASLGAGIGDIAIDDVSVVGGECDTQGLCSFEADSCQYTSPGMLSWNRLIANMSNRPVTDHTTETTEGHFMLADTSAEILQSSHALLVSPVQEPMEASGCFQFWFQMNGDHPGTLNVYVEEETQRKLKKWSMNTGQDQMWNLGSVTIQTAHTWKLMFEAIGGGAPVSHIAIDDVKLDHTECPEIGACDFERDLCSWKNVLNPKLDSMDWDWSNGQTPSSFKGPEVDNTKKDPQGHYMFVDFEALRIDDVAWLLSEHFPPTKGSCLSFYYSTNISEQLMHGVLKVFRYQMDQESVIWEAKGTQSKEWWPINITMESSTVFQIGFGAVKSNKAEVGYVAIDDIMYNRGVNCHGIQTDGAIWDPVHNIQGYRGKLFLHWEDGWC
ncbi:apical endosomal glycoprotein isoform X2 [Stegostoma tigrinum]|uniref:apical endosomal glycoprotein isoform X2 n=1 Tax=Stegostoma tigrinum TaxID=3053191 RepID=UPI00286FEDD0|nr:apical endosomal glycoprotein isoform X2 [Stegostoma tigrinum]